MQTRLVWAALVSLSWLSVGVAQDLPPVSGVGSLDLIEDYQPISRRIPRVMVKPVPQEPLPSDAEALVCTFDRESDAIRQKAEQEIQAKRQALIESLQALQDKYTRDAKLDEAVAIRDRIRQLKISQLKALPDPGTLAEYASRIGETFYFDVVGTTGYSVWGSEVYTYDSHLATAAVHAGVLKVGQRGIVKVTMHKSPEAHRGSTANGVTTSNWGPYTASYTVEPSIPSTAPALKAKPVNLDDETKDFNPRKI